MHRILPTLAAGATALVLLAAASIGVAWLRQAIPYAAKPDPPLAVPGKPGPIELASIPWKRNPAHPAKLREPLAVGGLPWLASADRPSPVDLAPAAIPWASVPPQPVNLAPAVLPWPIDKK